MSGNGRAGSSSQLTSNIPNISQRPASGPSALPSPPGASSTDEPISLERLLRDETFDYALAGAGYGFHNEPRFLNSYKFQSNPNRTGIFATYYQLASTTDPRDIWEVPVANLGTQKDTTKKLELLVDNSKILRQTYSTSNAAAEEGSQKGEDLARHHDGEGRMTVHVIELEEGTETNEANILKTLNHPLYENFSGMKDKYGLFFRGNQEKQHPSIQTSILSFRFPYITSNHVAPDDPLGQNTRDSGDTLPEFISETFKDVAQVDMNSEFLVQNARFTLFNDDVMLLARTGNPCTNLRGADLVCPHQRRFWGFHTFMTMVGATLRFHDRQVLSLLREKVTKEELEWMLRDLKSNKANFANIKVRKGLALQLKHLEIVVDMQINLLNNFRTFLRSANTDLAKSNIQCNAYTIDMRQIPVVTDDVTREIMAYVLTIAERIIEEREILKRNFEALRLRVIKLDDVNNLSSALDVLLSTHEEQKAQSRALSEEISFQGKQISAFTVLNAIFLPLNFFTQYFSADGAPRNGWVGNKIDNFWIITTPITIFVSIVAFYFMFRGWYSSREFRRFILDCWLYIRNHIQLSPFHLRGLIKRTDASTHHLYLIGQKKYYIQVVLQDQLYQRNPRTRYFLMEPDEFFRGEKKGYPFMVESVDHPTTMGKSLFALEEKSNKHCRLFIQRQDRYKYTLEAQITKSKSPGDGEPKLMWRSLRKAIEEEPHHFNGEPWVKYIQDPFGSQKMVKSLEFLWMRKEKTVGSDIESPKKLPWDTALEELKACPLYLNTTTLEIGMQNPFKVNQLVEDWRECLFILHEQVVSIEEPV